MPETTPLIKAALNLRVGVGFDVYVTSYIFIDKHIDITSDRIHIVKKIAPKPQMD